MRSLTLARDPAIIEAKTLSTKSMLPTQNNVSSPYDVSGPRLDATPWYRDDRLHGQLIHLADITSGSSILEIGSGTGFLLRQIGMWHVRITGIEPSRSMWELARGRCAGLRNVEILNRRFEDVESSLGMFDRIICKNVLHLIENPSGFLRLASKHLGPRGRLILVETVSPTLTANVFIKAFFRSAGLASHKSHYFRARDLSNIVTTAGFDVFGTRYEAQEILLEKWLDAKGVPAERRDEVRRIVRTALPTVRKDLQIRRVKLSDASDVSLLRLQLILSLRRGQSFN
jgi:2-polyprenyl-3-methyl-5-hydroxy-6-metoxy-1,4-benzoquinol methylase